MTAPGPADTPLAGNDWTAPMGDNQPVGSEVPGVARMYGGLYPRWPLLAAILMTPFIVIGYVIHLYYLTHSCPFGFICQVDLLNGMAQVGLIWLFFGVFWLCSFVFGVRLLEDPQTSDSAGHTGEYHPIARFVRTLSDFGPVRWLLVALGGVALLGAGASILLGRITPIALAFAGIVVMIGICALVWRVESAHTAARQPETAQEALQREARAATEPLNVFRSIPGINRIIPRRARQRNAAPPRP